MSRETRTPGETPLTGYASYGSMQLLQGSHWVLSAAWAGSASASDTMRGDTRRPAPARRDLAPASPRDSPPRRARSDSGGCDTLSREARNVNGASTRIGMERGLVVVVTGASAGLGRAIAHAWAQRGIRLGLMARGPDGLDAACHDVEALGGRAIALPVDVADADSVDAAAERVERESSGRSTGG